MVNRILYYASLIIVFFTYEADETSSYCSHFLVREILSITGITIHETGKPGTGARFEMAIPKGIYRFTGG